MSTGGRIVVIGAGAIGVTTALELARAGRHVTVVDAGSPGGGTSGTTFAWLNANDKSPRQYFDLNRAGLAAYRQLAADGGGKKWLRLTGHIEWADSDETCAALERRSERMRDWGYPVEAITQQQAERLEPDIRVAAGAEVRFFPEEGHVLPTLLLQDLARQARAAGVKFAIGESVVEFERRADALSAAMLSDGTTLPGDTFVAAAGRWTAQLASMAGVHVPMVDSVQGSRSLGLLGYSGPVESRVGRVISSPGLNVRPDTPGRRYVLQASDLDQSAVPGSAPAADGAEAREILRRAGLVLRNFDGGELESLRVGYRSIPADGLTVAGWAPGIDRLYFLATHSGMTLALVLAQLAAREIAIGSDEPILSSFRVTRFVESAAVGA